MKWNEVALLVIVLLIGLMLYQPTQGIDSEGYRKVDVTIEGHMIKLASGCDGLFIEAMPWEISSISDGLSGKVPERPGIHDLTADIISGLDAKPVTVLIDGQDGRFYARVIISGRKMLDLDAHPADAVALAVRTKIPILVRGDDLESLC